MKQHTNTLSQEDWDLVIEPKSSVFSLQLGEIWRYRDLLLMFVRRDVVTVYKQTILGPVWYVVQPILTTLIYMLVFGRIAGISTDGLPQVLFYLSGITIWNYFAESFNQTSKTFKENEQIFGKVYFPRLIMPLSKVTSGLIKFGIQFVFFLVFYFYFLLQGFDIHVTYALAYFPLFVLIMAGLGLGSGIIFTSLTAKYRDLTFLIEFGVRLLMYATPVIYPISTVPENYRWIIEANPITPIIEGFRLALLGTGSFEVGDLLYSGGFTLAVLLVGIVIFNRTEKTFMDTV
jgi:lipopolysaccharide transport system permease protein